MAKFYYHPVGTSDVCGVYTSPRTSDPGWITVDAKSYIEAVKKLPVEARLKIKKAHDEFKKSPDSLDGKSIEDMIGCYAGEGLGFTLLNQDEWENELYNESEDQGLE